MGSIYLSSCPSFSYLGTWKLHTVPLEVVKSAGSEPVALPLYPRQSSSITPIGRSLCASRALAKPLSSEFDFPAHLVRQAESPLTQWSFLSLQNALFCHVLANSDRYRWLEIWVIRFCRPLWFTRTNFVFAPFFNLSISPRFRNMSSSCNCPISNANVHNYMVNYYYIILFSFFY